MQRLSAVIALLMGLGSTALADHFDDHQRADLKAIVARSDADNATRISLTQLAGLPKVVQGAPQSVLLVIRTDDGNWCKLLVRGGGIKRKGSSLPRTFLHIERMATYSADPKRGVLAEKRDIYLFDGFAIDLDIGQIVKKGDGDDLSFDAGAPADKKGTEKEMMDGETPKLGLLQGTVIAAAGVDLYIPRKPLVAASKSSGRTKTSGAVTAADFVGKHRLDVDGRFTGVLQLRSEDGRIAGTFTSDQTKAVYQVAGSLGTPAQQLTLTISFPRTELKLDGRMFTRNRTKIAGTAAMEESTFGFVAERID